MSRMSNLHIRNAIKQLIDVKEVESGVQILNNALAECKLKISTLSNQGGGEIRKRGDFAGEYDRALKQGQ